eukprot:TRINITY_DN56990_c0_g1_i1.p1 TRINITY_DN56990_c0_g1~~TRINITY_DN56990_c0_g1_i1.p1  ORF type:complete len:378 (-),score=224.63 TRINITY_DN56990_c0_g1_i1:60-1193(-)
MADEEKQEPYSPNPDGARVLILGGVGFIGRNFVKYLCDNKLASRIRVVDKAMAITSYLHPVHKRCFDSKDVVESKQADLTRDAHVKRAFDADEPWDYVVNLCGETRFGLDEEEYRKKCVDTATKAGAAAKAMGVKKWIEVSTAQVYDPTDSASTEDAKIDPWTRQAKYRYMAEEELRKIGLPLVVLRPAMVYGPGDLTSLTPRITCATVYQVTKDTMKFLWGAKLKLNVVHVDDVCKAIWLSCTKVDADKVYNLADQTNLDQGKLTGWLGELFKIKTGFYGTFASNAARMNLSYVADVANDEHVPGWTTLCQKHNILNTPLSPYLDAELFRNNHLCIDGRRIAKEVDGFDYSKQVSKDMLEQQIRFFIDQKIFPPIL